VSVLTPLHFLDRAAAYFADRVAVVDGSRTVSYAALHQRARRLAGVLRDRGIRAGDRVAILGFNSLPLLEAHYGVPYAGAVLVALNTRLNPDEVAAILDHCEPALLIHDERLEDLAHQALTKTRVPPPALCSAGIGGDYEAALQAASEFVPDVTDERALLAIDYTSGTTGRPKGVMYSHRGAYLQALAMAFHTGLGLDTVFLWTLPMFHCNGWCFTWAVTAAGGRHVCLERPEPETTWRLVREEGVTHFNCAPTVLNDLLNSEAVSSVDRARSLRVAVGGAPPSPTLLARAAATGILVTHLYGLTETYGPAVICAWQPEWDAQSDQVRAVLTARQGVANVVTESLRVIDASGDDVPADGISVGEVALTGDNVMMGYYRDEAATAAAIQEGFFRTGDLGVRHPNGYIELTDRAKDVIISGGENIASVEVERVLAAHPAVSEVAVVAAPDPRWGEVPAAFVALREGAVTDEIALTEFAREQLAHYKVPKRFTFGPLPKTSTGKIQKHLLRRRASELWPAESASATTFLEPQPRSPQSADALEDDQAISRPRQ
jgi:fatty-acyl-CoA synthase